MALRKKSSFGLGFYMLSLFGIAMDKEQARRNVKRADRGQTSPPLPYKNTPRGGAAVGFSGAQ